MTNKQVCLRDYPSDLIPSILNKLPLKSLSRFKCVSKTWLSLIIDEYHRKQRRPIFSRALESNTNTDRMLRIYSIDGTTGIANHMYTFSYSLSFGSCFHFNGLFYFFDYEALGLRVCNPVTQEIVLLPDPDTYFKTDSLFDMGFDPLSKKYKMLSWRDYPHCEILTLGSESWRVISSIPPQECGRPSTESVCIHGTLYWYREKTNMMIYFHLGDERFGAVKGPNRVTWGQGRSRILHIFELEGSLCLADSHAHLNTLDLWMLKDDCCNWIIIASIIPPSKSIEWMLPYSTRTGEVVLGCDYTGSGSILYLYSFITHQFDTIQVSGVTPTFVVTDYVANSICLEDL